MRQLPTRGPGSRGEQQQSSRAARRRAGKQGAWDGNESGLATAEGLGGDAHGRPV